ncbi:DUF305 domain-containing protein [Nocardioides mesophilus]|uniref:DUF305 domain-containing protein n=1 Tax=Nocardioides mesophilus TaxID=433659 RepID=A0A7G9R7I1_9ACTN|nr:DUF305 domain-containing protein [Nocardioides mesophilus]QNN51556.1 DUF305 domain-containing protein [Nocardioides mesophilus]
MRSFVIRTTTTRLGVLLSGLLLAGCGTGEDHNDADVEFATDMIGHHAQAIEMANYTIGRDGLDPRITELAEDIRVSQTEEIDAMSAWLEEWEEPVPETGFATGDGHSHSEGGHDDGGDGTTGMPGMMGEAEMERLAQAPDRVFEDLWLQMMIAHHEGAVEMAGRVLEQGESEDVATLASDVRTAQAEEIEAMRGWRTAG